MADIFNWFPGHMAKSIKELKEKIKLVDLVILLKDARICSLEDSSLFIDLVKSKPVIEILTKSSYADSSKVKEYVKKNKFALDVDLVKNINTNKIKPFINNFASSIIKKRKSKGIINETLKILVIGFPNVGKSSFINFLNNKKSLKVGNLPGVTRSSNTWIKVDNLMLLDTPGILVPKFSDLESAYFIALCGIVKQDVLPLEDVIIFGVNYLLKNYKEEFLKRFNLSNDEDIYYNIALKRSCLKNNLIDYNKLYTLLFNEFKNGLVAKVFYSLEMV